MALGELYVAQKRSRRNRRRARKSWSTNLQAALKARIENLDWMSDETKAKAIEKWATFLPKIGYPDKWRDWSASRIGTRQLFRQRRRRGSEFNTTTQWPRSASRSTALEWGMTPQTVNAYYNPTAERDHVPGRDPAAAVLRREGRRRDQLRRHRRGDRPRDDARLRRPGSQFDAKGNNVNWWTQDDRKQFEARTDKLVKQFDDYEPLTTSTSTAS